MVFHSLKNFKFLKKICLKKTFQPICADKIFKTVCGIFFKIYKSQYILCLFVCLFYPWIKYKNHIQKVTTTYNYIKLQLYKDITIAHNHIMDLWRMVLRSELSFSREGTCSRLQGLISKSLKLQYCSRSSLHKGALKHSCPKNHRRSKKRKNEKTCNGLQKLKDHWSFA